MIYQKISNKISKPENLLKNDKYNNEILDSEEAIKPLIDKNKNFPYNFELIDENIFEKLIKNKNESIKMISKVKCFINEGKIVIKYFNKEKKNFMLIIGKYKIDNSFESLEILFFNDEDKLKSNFKILKKEQISQYLVNHLKKNEIYENDSIIGEYLKINETVDNNISKKHLNIIKFLINLSINYEKLSYKAETCEKSGNEEKYFLINKKYLEKFKASYKYNNIINKLKSDEQLKIIYNNIKHNINLMEEKINDITYLLKDFIDENEKVNENELKDYKFELIEEKEIIIKPFNNKKIKYFINFEIFPQALIELFLSIIDNKKHKIDKYKQITCIFSMYKIIIELKENNDIFYDIYYIEKELLNIEYILLQKSNQNLTEILDNDLISSLYFDNEGICDLNHFLIVKPQTDFEKNSIISPLMILIFIYINSEEIKKKIKLDINLNYKITNNDEYEFDEYYLMNIKDYLKFIEDNKLKDIHYFLYNNLNKDKAQNIIHNQNYNLESKANNIISLIDKSLLGTIDSKNKQNFQIEFYDELDLKFIQIGNQKKIDYFENFIILNKEIINCFKINNKNNIKFKCFFGDNKLFLKIKNKKIVEIYKTNDKLDFNIEYILDFKDKLNEHIGILLKNGYNKYINSYFEFINGLVSPIFLDYNTIIGNAYCYNPLINDYSVCFINNNLKAMILYYFNTEKLKNQTKKEYKDYFYLINKEYFLQFMERNKFNIVKEKLKNFGLINQLLKKDNENFGNILTEKQISYIVNNISQDKPENIIENTYEDINIYLNKKNQNFGIETFYKQEEPHISVVNYINNNKYDSIMYYDNLFIIHERIYRLLFVEGNKDKNICSKCIFANEIIFIRLTNYLNTIQKTIYEVGEIVDLNYEVFKPKYIILYNNKDDIYTHLNLWKNKIKECFSQLNFNNTNTLPLNLEKINAIIINLSIPCIPPDPRPLPIVPTPAPTPVPITSPRPNLSIETEFPFAPKIGLQNVGATCYMNATLQCFCQIKKYIEFFKYNSQIFKVCNEYKKNNNYCLTKAFKILIENLWPSVYEYIDKKHNHQNSSNKYYAPYDFKETISCMNPLFEGVQANDSKDLVNFIIMTLHDELNKAPNNNIINNNQIIDQTNENEVFQHFSKDFTQKNRSLISDIFYAMNGTSTQCSGCNVVKYNFQIYFFLIFPLEEVRKLKIQNLTTQFISMNQNTMMMNPMVYQQILANFQFNIQNINSVNLNDCFEYNQKVEYFSGENSMYCNICKKQLSASYRTILYTTPEILVIVLNRGKGIEFKVKLEFEENLDLKNFVKFQQTGFLYKLIGVVTHLGESGASGHFIAYCKSPIDKLWYRYNDDIVSKVDNFKREIIDYAMPYILFFQKTDNL